MISKAYSGYNTPAGTTAIGDANADNTTILHELYFSNLSASVLTVEIFDDQIDFRVTVPANDVTAWKPAEGYQLRGQLYIRPSALIDYFCGME